MKVAYAIGMGASLAMFSASAWMGCSSNSSTAADAGTDSPSGSSSSGTASNSSSSSSSGGSSSSSSSSGGSTDGGALTFAQVYTDVISPFCADCHGRLPAPDGGIRGGLRVGLLDMSTPDAAFSNLINVRSKGTGSPAAPDAAFCDTLEAGATGSMRVVPGSASQSLLCLKVHGFVVPPPCGAPMPEPTPGPGEIMNGGQDAAFTEVRDWINQGALP